MKTLLFITTLLFPLSGESWKLPIESQNRESFRDMRLTKIGHFGMNRIARVRVPAHLHTAIDICRPDSNYVDSPIYAVGTGKVISMRDDGPYAQVIISHGDTIWSVYEHISGITVSAGDSVKSNTIIGRFLNQQELNSYGWHFDHVHFELMKKRPAKRDTLPGQQNLHYATFALTCYTQKSLNENYYNPILFFRGKWKY